MDRLINILLCLGLLAAGLMGLTLSLPLQAPGLIILGVCGLLSVWGVYRKSFNPRLLFLVIIALGYFLLRAVFSPVEDLALEDLFLILAAGLLYFTAGVGCSNAKVRVVIAMTVLLLLCLHLGSALMQTVGGKGYGLVWMFTHGVKPEGNVVTGMYGYRGSFANFAIISGLLALCLGVWGRFSKPYRWILCGLGVTALIFAGLAHSRSAMISLGGGGLVFLILLWMSVAHLKEELRNKLRITLVVIGCVAFVASIAGTAMVFQNRAQNTAQGADAMFDSDVRLAFWPMAIEQFVDHPWIGAGSRSFSYECFYYWSPNMDTGEANPEFVHNEYLQALADYGLVGFLLIISLYAIHFLMGVIRVRSLSERLGKDGFKNGSNAMALAIAGSVGMVVMAVHIVFDFRTHLMANLLLLVCCFVWVLPATRGVSNKQGRLISSLIAMVLFLLGGAALFAGVKQLKGGWPLLKNKMATEHGTWDPSTVDRDVWIPGLEESIRIAPSYRRHLRLGTLYRLEADELEGDDHVALVNKAIEQYQKASLRHPYEPVSQLNLAGLHTYLKEYEKADTYFENTDRLASSRERWFRIHTKWADMHRQWAGVLWRGEDQAAAERHYLRALKILKEGKVKSSDTTQEYLMVIIEYARMLDSQNNYEAADQLFEKAEESLPIYVVNSRKRNIRREMGEHYLRKAKYLWYKRQPEAAYEALIKAERSYRIHQVVLKGREDEQWKKGYDEVKQILKFFKETGVGAVEGR